jgi:hypothetical protein
VWRRGMGDGFRNAAVSVSLLLSVMTPVAPADAEMLKGLVESVKVVEAADKTENGVKWFLDLASNSELDAKFVSQKSFDAQAKSVEKSFKSVEKQLGAVEKQLGAVQAEQLHTRQTLGEIQGELRVLIALVTKG